jgi:periplasmic protein TonB
MEPNKILQADVLDIIFENRNKDYGAYELRKKYNKRITLALVITAAVAALAIGGTVLAKNLKPSDDDKLQVEDMSLKQIEEPPPPELPPPPPPKAPPPPPQMELTKFTPPVIKKDEEVQKQEMPPQEDLEETKIAEITQEGDKDLNATIPPVVEESKGTVVGPTVDENQIFTKVEIEASVDAKQWKRYLENNLQRYIEDARDQGLAPGQYTVQVRFLVERDGSIADVQALNDPGYGLSKGAVDVLRKGPKWTPGIQNGQKVRSYRTQPITFLLTEE